MSVGPAFVLACAFGLLLALGVPVAFALGLAAAAGLLVSIDAGPALTTLAQQTATGLDSFALLAIPLFVLSGQIMNRGGVARRLVDLGKAIAGVLPGGLAWVNVVACTLFGAISGSAVAATAAIGGFMTPQMEREGYDRGYAAAVNLTSSTTGLLIPPSNILIVYALASGGASVAALFLAGYLPGLLVASLLGATAAWIATRRGYPRAGATGARELGRRLLAALPSLGLIVLVMGGIVAGVFTATEAAGVAVLYALVLTLAVHRELRLRELPRVLVEAATTTGVVLLLIGTSMALSWVLAYERIPQAIAESLLALGGGTLVVLLLINVVLLAVGAVLDMTPAVLIFTPIFLPVVTELGMDPIHFGIVLVLNLCIGLCTPPVGTVLFVGLGVARVPLGQTLPFLLPLYLAMLIALAIVTLAPALSLWLPRSFGFVG
ncbi:MAG TPA: TRAP transporter large permease [Thermoanaerobaculia bacterium]|nr:TRAP transporter large permease [Thermoanaerobaculia bacterium]